MRSGGIPPACGRGTPPPPTPVALPTIIRMPSCGCSIDTPSNRHVPAWPYLRRHESTAGSEEYSPPSYARRPCLSTCKSIRGLACEPRCHAVIWPREQNTDRAGRYPAAARPQIAVGPVAVPLTVAYSAMGGCSDETVSGSAVHNCRSRPAGSIRVLAGHASGYQASRPAASYERGGTSRRHCGPRRHQARGGTGCGQPSPNYCRHAGCQGQARWHTHRRH